MGEPGLPAHHRLTGGQPAQINGRPRTSGPVAVWERSAAGRAYGHSWRAVGGRVAAPSKARDAGHGIQCRGRAGGSWPGPRGRRPTEAKHARRGGPTARPFCKSFLLERDLAADGPCPQTPGGGALVLQVHGRAGASPADAWRRIVSGHRGRRSRSIARRRVAAEAWESRRARDVQRATTFDARGPLTLKTGCRICAPLIHTC